MEALTGGPGLTWAVEAGKEGRLPGIMKGLGGGGCSALGFRRILRAGWGPLAWEHGLVTVRTGGDQSLCRGHRRPPGYSATDWTGRRRGEA